MSMSSCALKRQVSVASLAGFLILAFLSPAALAQQSSVPEQAVTQPLITQAIDESKLTVLTGNTHPLARTLFDLGTAPATLPMSRMQLVLKRSAAQEFALRTLLDNQQEKHSANYHKWLAPEEFGKQFGPTDGDIQIITAWLQSHGFQVGTTKGRTVLEFSGSASQVQEAFHTAIHRYVVNGEEHWANASDPAIPTALAPAVAGVLTLHNFLKKPALRMLPQPFAGKIQPGKRPALTFSDGTHGMAPADFATIYNSASLLIETPTAINGTGVTIAVVARSNLYSVDSPAEDITDFRSSEVFDLVPGSFNVVLNGPDPGDLGGGDEAEATLDASWSGAVAPGANIDFVVSASTNTADGTDLSEIYIVENNLADVMTESFSSCEGVTTTTEAAATSLLAEQAAAQGITYFVSTGDSGAEGCDDPDTETVATQPISVNVLASTPFTVAVGGTLFNDTADPTKYWAATNTNQESALSYIPEDVWNDSCLASSSTCSGANIAAGGGGASTFFAKPSWQAGVTGIINDNARDLPDVSLNADPHDGYVICLEASCVPDSSGNFSIYLVGGTSASAPSFAGIMALVDQQVAAGGGGTRQGQANYILYKLAEADDATLSACNGSNTLGLPASTCNFNDVTVGNNAVPGEVNYGLTTAQYQATSGYDLATGLGSVNISNLVNKWSTVTFQASTTTLGLTPAAITHGQAVTAAITVAPSTTTGTPPTPTGDVSLIAQTGPSPSAQTFVGEWTLASGLVNQPTNYLPGGSYSVSAHYAGDGTYGGSDSPAVPVTVTAEGSTTTLSVLTFDSAGDQFNFTGGPFGSFVYLRADVAGLSGHGTPTGSVTFSDTFGALNGGNSYALNSGDALQSGAYAATPNGVLFDTGSHVITASYPGDASFNASSSAAAPSFSITPGFFVTTPGNTEPTVVITAPGATGSATVSISASTGFTTAIALACSGLPVGAACTFSPASITPSGKLTTTSSTVTVTTTAPTAAVLQSPKRPGFERWLAFSGFMLLSVVVAGVSGRRRLPLYTVALLTLIILSPACGGGGSKSTTPPPPVTVTPTPAGTTNITVNATSGSSVSSTQFVLVVE